VFHSLDRTRPRHEHCYQVCQWDFPCPRCVDLKHNSQLQAIIWTAYWQHLQNKRAWHLEESQTQRHVLQVRLYPERLSVSNHWGLLRHMSRCCVPWWLTPTDKLYQITSQSSWKIFARDVVLVSSNLQGKRFSKNLRWPYKLHKRAIIWLLDSVFLLLSVYFLWHQTSHEEAKINKHLIIL
jgi:hypothetical protein